jgi:GTP-binding protein
MLYRIRRPVESIKATVETTTYTTSRREHKGNCRNNHIYYKQTSMSAGRIWFASARMVAFAPTNSFCHGQRSPTCSFGLTRLATTTTTTTTTINSCHGTSPRFLSTSTTNKYNELVVSILGPPNAGKSTLFNRLMCRERNRAYRLGSESKPVGQYGGKGRIGSNQRARGGAIVSAIPGTTRDRRECYGRIGGTTFRLIDTAGVDGERIGLLNMKKARDSMERSMIEQTLAAAKSCDLVLLMFDARVGITHDLEETARWLRKLENTPRVLVLANKLEGDRWAYDGSPVMGHLEEVLRVGFGEAIPVSAEHGEGMADIAIVMEEVMAEKKNHSKGVDDDADEGKEKPLQLAILGRQNVGKSTLVNALLQQERVISGPMPGLTRDAISVEWSFNGRPVQLVDTAGIRKLSLRLDDDIEDLAVADALRAMKLADVAVLVLDAQALFLQRQELAIANAVIQEGRALVIAANKMDLLELDGAEYTPQDFAAAVHEQLEARIPMFRQTPIVPMSSLTGDRVIDLMPVVFRARDRWARTIPTGTLNRWLKEVVDGSPPPTVSGVSAKIKYILQTKGRPPTFLLFCNVDDIPETYLRYLTKHFQDTFEMYGMQVRLIVKKSATNPYDNKNVARKRGGSGLGGKEARKKRLFHQLNTTGGKVKRTRKRSQKQQ